MSWSADMWFDLVEAEALAGEEPLPIPPGVCADCHREPHKSYNAPRILHERDGLMVCGRHAAKRDGLTRAAWESRRYKQAKRDKLNPAGKAAREHDGVS